MRWSCLGIVEAEDWEGYVRAECVKPSLEAASKNLWRCGSNNNVCEHTDHARAENHVEYEDKH